MTCEQKRLLSNILRFLLIQVIIVVMTTTKQMCSLFAREQGEDPAGTAGRWDLYVIMELPLPWAKDPWQSPRLPDGLQQLAARAQARGLKVRALAMQPDADYSQAGQTRIFVYRRPPEPLAYYAKSEYLVPCEEVTPFLDLLFRLDGRDEDDPTLDPYRQPSEHIREMMVCTHGTRDACCGKFGYRIYTLLRHVHAPTLEGKVRAWRVSHLGGHRFAPNLLDFPEARYWGHLDEAALESILFRERPAANLRLNYRGWSALEPLAQVAEREMLLQEGWAWAAYLKSARVIEAAGENAPSTVQIEYAHPVGTPLGAYEATVEKTGSILMNTCLKEEAPREVSQYAVTRLEKTITSALPAR